MTRDASLDEFFGGESGVESGASDASEGSDIDAEAAESEVVESVVEEDGDGGSGASVSPASATYVWTPAGDACARCGESVERMWRCGEKLVCGECKEW